MSTIKPLSVSAKRLAATISGSDSSFKLDNILTWDGTTDLVAGDFGTVAYASFRNSAGTLIEFIAFDPSTIASGSITILYRGLAYNGDNLTTEIAANKLTWVKGDTIVELGTHLPQLLAHYVDIVGDQTIAGAKTFSAAPASSVAAVTSTELVRKAELDAAVLGSITNAPVVVPGTAGATLAIDQHVYQDPADQEWKLCDADTAGSVENVILGITRGSGVDGGAIANGVTILGEHEAASAIFTAGKVYASNTAGEFSSSPGTTEVTLGIAKSTTKIDFTPRYDQTITEDIQDALAGSEGTPSDANRYTTETAVQKGVHVYAADGGSNDTYVITLDPVPAGYTTGMVIHFKANTINTGACTINVNALGAKSIKKLHDQDPGDGDIEAGSIVTLVYDGTNFQMQTPAAIALVTEIQDFASSGTWTKAAGAVKVFVQAWGGGGSGYNRSSTGGAGGGGGGAYFEGWFAASDLGATETVTIGDGGAAQASDDALGNAGVDTTFGSFLTAFAGQGGAIATNEGTGGHGGTPLGNVDGIWGAGVVSSVGQKGLYSGGGGGGINGAAGKAGGASIYGGGGGGGSGNATAAGGASTHGGAGGASSVTGTAVSGSVPGGGGGSNANGTGSSGAGGKGQMIVTTFF